MSQANATIAYQKNAVLTASREKLVIMMYDGALRFVEQAKIRLEEGDRAECGTLIGRAFNIVSELKVSLNFDVSGEDSRRISGRLEQLYTYVMDELVQANATRAATHLDHASDILATLREGWVGAIQSR